MRFCQLTFKIFCHSTPSNPFATVPLKMFLPSHTPKFFAIYPLKLFLSHQLTKFVLRRHPQKYCYPNLKVFSQPIPKLICHPTRTTKKNSQSTPKLFCLLPLLKYLPPYYSKIILPPTTKIFYPTSQNVFVTYSQFFKTQLHQKYFAVQPQEFFATLPSNNFFGHQNILSTSSVPSSITSISCAHKRISKTRATFQRFEVKNRLQTNKVILRFTSYFQKVVKMRYRTNILVFHERYQFILIFSELLLETDSTKSVLDDISWNFG